MSGPGTNTGHGHVWERPDGVKARCGGPAICASCAKDHAMYGKPAPAQVEPKSVEILRPQAGDVIVITVDREVMRPARDAISKAVQEAFPGLTVMIVPDHWKFQIVRPPPSLDMGTQLVGPGFESHNAPITRESP